MNEQSRTLVALDMDTADAALDLARRLQGQVAGYKVGLELVNAAGFGLLDDLKALAGRRRQDLLRLQVPRHPQHGRGRVAGGGPARRLDVQRPCLRRERDAARPPCRGRRKARTRRASKSLW